MSFNFFCVVIVFCFLFDLGLSLKLNSTYCVEDEYVDPWGNPSHYQIHLQQNKDMGKNIFEGNYVDVSTNDFTMVWCFYDEAKSGDEVFMSCFVQGEPLFLPSSAMFRVNKNGVKSFEEIWFEKEEVQMRDYDFKVCKFKDLRHPEMDMDMDMDMGMDKK